MSIQVETAKGYTILEAATLSGLPESTLRYYETIGLIDPIQRDASSKHRVYTDDNIDLIVGIACLSATGMSIVDMRTYLANRGGGASTAQEQIGLLETQKNKLSKEAYYLTLRQRYVETKIGYWKAVLANDSELVETIRQSADAIAKELKLPRK